MRTGRAFRTGKYVIGVGLVALANAEVM